MCIFNCGRTIQKMDFLNCVVPAKSSSDRLLSQYTWMAELTGGDWLSLGQVLWEKNHKSERSLATGNHPGTFPIWLQTGEFSTPWSSQLQITLCIGSILNVRDQSVSQPGVWKDVYDQSVSHWTKSPLEVEKGYGYIEGCCVGCYLWG